MRGYYSNDDLELEVAGKVYKVAVEAECDYWHQAARPYLRNGDPGWPEDWDFEITDLSAQWKDENDNEVEQTEEMESVLTDYLNGLSDEDWGLVDNENDPYDERDKIYDI